MYIFYIPYNLCGFRNIAPTGGVARAFEVMPDGIGKDIGFTLSIFLRVLLGTEDNGLSTVFAVYLIQDLVELLHLLMTLCIIIDEVRLDAGVRNDSHDDDASPFIVEALTKDPLRASGGRLDDLLGVVGGCEQPFLTHVPILGQVFPEMIGVNEDADGLGYRLLLPQLFGTPGRIVADMGTQIMNVSNHSGKAT